MPRPMPPALVPIVGPVCAETGSDGLPEHDMAVLFASYHSLSSTLAHDVHDIDRAVDLRMWSVIFMMQNFSSPRDNLLTQRTHLNLIKTIPPPPKKKNWFLDLGPIFAQN